MDNQLGPPGIPIGQAMEQQEKKEAEINQHQEHDENAEENTNDKALQQEERDAEKEKHDITDKAKDEAEKTKVQPAKEDVKRSRNTPQGAYTQGHTRNEVDDDIFAPLNTSKKLYGLMLVVLTRQVSLFLYAKRLISPRQFGIILVFTCLMNVILFFRS